ncbi:hypothetical protein SAMN06297422_10115 [Lachnospiraceae bacterium]|nr:hypothetical protein SAMN06297422_10115 [Lachnospiraceae bacterium]
MKEINGIEYENGILEEEFHNDIMEDLTGSMSAIYNALPKNKKNEFLDSEMYRQLTTQEGRDDSGLIIDQAFEFYNKTTFIDPSKYIRKPLHVKSQKGLNDFRKKLNETADEIDKIIDGYQQDDVLGKKAKEVIKTVSSNNLRNTAKGYPQNALGYKTPLSQVVKSYAATFQNSLEGDTLKNNIKKYQKDFPIYDLTIEAGKLRDTLVDYYVDKDKNGGALNAEKENKYRQKIYDKVVVVEDYMNKVIAYSENKNVDQKLKDDYVLDKSEKVFNIHPASERGLSYSIYGLQAYKVGLENGWALDDIPLLATFHIMAENEAIKLKGGPFKSVEEFEASKNKENVADPEKAAFVKKMQGLYEELKTTKLNSEYDRKQALDKMGKMVMNGIAKGFLINKDKDVEEPIEEAVYFNQLFVQQKAREQKIAKGLEPSVCPPVEIKKDVKLQYISATLNTKRTDGWWKSESTTHKNLRNAVTELELFFKNNKAPGEDASQQEKEKYFEQYFGKLDKVQYYTNIYIDKRQGASSSGGKERFKGALDLSYHVDLEKERIADTLTKNSGLSVNELRNLLVKKKTTAHLNEISSMGAMPADKDGLKQLTDRVADIMVGKLIDSKAGEKVFNEMGAEMMKSEILKDGDFQKLMKNYYKDKNMTPQKLVQELKGDGVNRQLKSINKQMKKTSEQLDKKAAQKQAAAMKK